MRSKLEKTLTAALILAVVSTAHGLEVSAKSAVILDEKTGKILFEKDKDATRFPASTTKIMTAMLLLERCTLGEMITAPKGVEEVTGASLHLKPGEKVSVKEMLYAILLRSANDGCYAAAIHVSGSIDKFSKLMNERAKQLGCTNTKFHNPHGLNDNLHTTSAYDLALIAREAMKYDLFREIVSKRKHVITRSMNQEDTLIVSKNKYLDLDPTADGIKTGYTNPAGQCYVGSATRNGYRVITVVLKSDGWIEDHKNMLDWTFANHERQMALRAGQVVGEAPVALGAKPTVRVEVQKDLECVVNKTSPQGVMQRLDVANVKAPVKRGQKLGQVVLYDATGWQERVPVFASEDVGAAQKAPWSYVVLLGGMGTGYYWIRRKRRRSRLYGKTYRRSF